MLSTRLFLALFAVSLAVTVAAVPATYTRSLFAGTGSDEITSDGSLATSGGISPAQLASSPITGELFFIENPCSIRKVDNGGLYETVVGGSCADSALPIGLATLSFDQPTEIAFDGEGNLYVLDYTSSGGGTTSTVVKIDFNSNTATSALTFASSLEGMSVSNDGRYVYAYVNPDIYEFDTQQNTNRIVTSDPGSLPILTLSADQKSLYGAARFDNIIKKIDIATGTVTVAAGINLTFPTAAQVDVPALSAIFENIVDLATDANGNIVVGLGVGTSFVFLFDTTADTVSQVVGTGFDIQDGDVTLSGPSLTIATSPNLLTSSFVSSDLFVYDFNFGVTPVVGLVSKHTFPFTAATVAISASGTVLAEDENNPITFTVTRTGSLAFPLTVPLIFSGDAVEGVDLTISPASIFTTGSILIPAGQSSASFTFSSVANNVLDTPKTATITIDSKGIAYNILTASQTVSVVETTAVPVVSASFSPLSVDEGLTSTVRFTRSIVTLSPLTVSFTLSGTASLNTDYTGDLNGLVVGTNTITIPGDRSFADIVISTLTDIVDEPTETVIITPVTTSDFNAGSAATLNINNVAAIPSVSITSNPATLTEDSGSSSVFTITRSFAGASPLDVLVNFGGSATFGGDYIVALNSAAPGQNTVRIPAGQTSVSFQVAVVPDNVANEGTESVIVVILPQGGYTISVGTASLAITDATGTTPAVTVRIDGSSALNEGSIRTFDFVFERTSIIPNPDLTVDFTVTGSATAGSDYTIEGTAVSTGGNAYNIVFPNGRDVVTVVVTIIDDDLVESDETIIFTITTGSGYVIGGSGATATIVDNDNLPELPIVTVSCDEPEFISEDSGTLSFVFSREGDLDSDVEVDFVLGGTVDLSADILISGAIVSPTGEGKITITRLSSSAVLLIRALADLLVEETESVTVDLVPSKASPSVYNLGLPDNAVGRVFDVPPVAPVVYLENSQASAITEGDERTITVFRTGVTTVPITVIVALSGTATPSADYTVSGQDSFDGNRLAISFPAGSSQVVLVVSTTDDQLVEITESLIISVIPNGYDVDVRSSLSFTIVDNDEPTITLTVSYPQPGTPTYTLAFSNIFDDTSLYTFAFGLSSSTLTYGTDFELQGGSGVVSIENSSEKRKKSTSTTVFVTVDFSVGPDQDYIYEIITVNNLPFSNIQQSLTVTVRGSLSTTVQMFKENPLAPGPVDIIPLPTPPPGNSPLSSLPASPSTQGSSVGPIRGSASSLSASLFVALVAVFFLFF